VQSHLHDFAVSLTHVSRCRVTVDVHGGADVGVSHEFLLHSDWGSYRVDPHPVRVSECMRANVPDACFLASTIKLPPSGYVIEDTLRESISYYAKRVYDVTLDIDWQRWGLIEDDFANHGIASIEPKEGDSNLPGFRARFGADAEFAEIDSLPTQELIDRVRGGIESCKDASVWQEDLETQSDYQKKLKKAMSKLH